MTMVRASATRCCWPPESCDGRRSRECREPDELERGLRRRGRSRRRGNLPLLQAEGDIAPHRHVRPQRIGLEDHADVALPGRQARDIVLPPTSTSAAVGLVEAGDQAQQRRLAAAGWAEKGEELARSGCRD